jgi:hypothetical protein
MSDDIRQNPYVFIDNYPTGISINNKIIIVHVDYLLYAKKAPSPIMPRIIIMLN